MSALPDEFLTHLSSSFWEQNGSRILYEIKPFFQDSMFTENPMERENVEETVKATTVRGI